MNKVMVTGLGSIAPAGVGTEQLWSALCERRTNFTAMEPVYVGLKSGLMAGRISEHDRSSVDVVAGNAVGRRLPGSSAFAVHAALQAVEDAGLRPGHASLQRALVVVGNNEAEADLVDEMVEGDPSRWRDHVYSSHSIAGNVARAIGSKGPSFTVHNTCASGNVALEHALRMVRRGVVETAVVVGGDVFSGKVWAGFSTLNALGPERCRPFSSARRPITISEGGAALVLQAAGAVQREGGPRAELIAAVSNNDACHPTNPDPDGVSACHRALLRSAGLRADDVDAIFAHGTGTRANDAVEAQIFSAGYPRAAVTAMKGTVGHLMATAGVLGAVASCLALERQYVPPTNIERDELEYDFDLIVGERGADRPLRYVQNNAFGFGGNNAISLFARVDR